MYITDVFFFPILSDQYKWPYIIWDSSPILPRAFPNWIPSSCSILVRCWHKHKWQYWLQVYSNGSTETEIVSQFISEENFIFTAEWMLIVEWNRVPQFGGPRSEVNTTDIYIPSFPCLGNESPREFKRYTNTIICSIIYRLIPSRQF